MKIVNGSHTQTIIRDFRYAEFEPNKFVYSITINGDKAGEGITDKKGIASLKKSGYAGRIVDKNLRKNEKAGTVHYSLLSEEIYTDFLNRGYMAFLDRKNDNQIQHEFFDYIVNGGDLSRIVYIKSYDHSVWRLDGTMFPTPIAFDYIAAKMNSNNYDIPRAFDILKSREDVIFLDDRNGVAEKPSVLRVPYYNSDCGHSCLAFLWKPSQEQAELIYKANSSGGSGGYKLIFDEDMLGLRAGGAALFDDFYGEYASCASDDDD